MKGCIVLIFKGLKAVNMKVMVCWALMTFSLVDKYQYFGGTYPEAGSNMFLGKSTNIHRNTRRYIPQDRNLWVLHLALHI
jgi:hypothetical protein